MAEAKRICSIPGCEKSAKARGMCGKHYMRWWTHGNTDDPVKREPEVCSVDKCDQTVLAKSMCSRHYDNTRRYGSPLSLADLTPMQRIERTGWDVTELGCWEWRGTRGARGYAYINIDGQRWIVSRLVLTLSDPPSEDGLVTRHTCDNPPCVNPSHLVWGDTHDNSQDMISRNREASFRSNFWDGKCKKGLHDVTSPESVFMERSGAWRCRACREASYLRKRQRKHEAKKKAAREAARKKAA